MRKSCRAGLVLFTMSVASAQTGYRLAEGAASWGFVTPYGIATATDIPQRTARNVLFNGWSGEAALSGDSRPSSLNYRPYVELLDIVPLNLADLGAIGTVTAGHSYLSADQTTIYSEMQFHVTEVLYTSATAPVSVGMTISVLRPGGVVRMAPGIVLLRGSPLESLPRINHQYLFLLKYSASAGAFPLVTAYELAGDTVYLLDTVIKGPGGFTLGHYGKSTVGFLSDVIAAITAAKQ